MAMKDSTPTPPLIRYAAPALLVIVALVQITVAHTTELTPWKGGGFGMFSTVDDPDARWIRCFVVVNGKNIPVATPPYAFHDATVAESMPSSSRLLRLALGLARVRWVTEAFDRDPKDPCPSPDPTANIRAWEPDDRAPAANEIAHVSAVRVELWRLRFDLPTRRLVARRADVVVHEVAQ
jgi:hypothetical protein